MLAVGDRALRAAIFVMAMLTMLVGRSTGFRAGLGMKLPFRLGRRSLLAATVPEAQAAVPSSPFPPQSSLPVRVRFAPSPTGSLHVGGARTALYNWLLAKKTGGTFIIRVEDTDEARSTRESEKSILDDLRWLTLSWDEGPEVEGPHSPYRQSERKHIYREAAERLMAAGHAYRCFCTEEELEQKRLAAESKNETFRYDETWRDADPQLVQRYLEEGRPYTVRFRLPRNKIVSFEDVVRGRVTWGASAMLGDFIILRSNGMPVYNFCVSVDDAAMRITHVVRADEHLSNTLRQLLILEALGYTPPTYAHCSLILGADRSKLSKRHGATSVKQFAEQGFLPSAMINYLALLGWNEGTVTEIYSPQELIQAFDVSRIVKAAAVFDIQKLTWINTQHLRALPADSARQLILKHLRSGGDAAVLPSTTSTATDDTSCEGSSGFGAFVESACRIVRRDWELATDTNRLLGACLQFHPEFTVANDSHALALEQSAECKNLASALCADWASGALPRGREADFSARWTAYVKALGGRLGLKGKHLFHPLRFLLTGRMSGPDVGDQLQLLALAEDHVRPGYPLVSLAERIRRVGKRYALPLDG